MTKVRLIILSFVFFVVSGCASTEYIPVASMIETHRKPAGSTEPYTGKVKSSILKNNTVKVALLLESPVYPNYANGFSMYIWNENIDSFISLVDNFNTVAENNADSKSIRLGRDKWHYWIYEKKGQRVIRMMSRGGEFIFHKRDMDEIVKTLKEIRERHLALSN